MPKKEIGHPEHKETHTYRELCIALFQMKVDIAEFTRSRLTQESIDQLPQMVRLANEGQIRKMGFDPNIDEEFRLQVATNHSLETIMEEGFYYRALEGGVSIDLIKPVAKE